MKPNIRNVKNGLKHVIGASNSFFYRYCTPKLTDGGGAFFVTSTVIGGLAWSDYVALAERAALLSFKPRLHGLGDDR